MGLGSLHPRFSQCGTRGGVALELLVEKACVIVELCSGDPCCSRVGPGRAEQGPVHALCKIEGNRRKAWQRMRRLNSITDSMVMNLSKLQETGKEREALHAAVPGVTRSWT